MRAIAPHWQAQKASWGEAADLFERLAAPAIWLCRQLAAIESKNAHSYPEPLIRLLASSAATVLKAARAANITDELKLPWLFAKMLRESTALRPVQTSFLLIPRMAAGACGPLQGALPTLCCANRVVASALDLSQCGGPDHYPLLVLGSCHMLNLANKALAVLQHCSGPTATRRYAHLALGNVSRHSVLLSTLIYNYAARDCKGDPYVSVDELHSLLSSSLCRLLYSPLLDSLVALQHVMTGNFPLQQLWESSSGASICLAHLPPAMAKPDTMDCKVAMLVSRHRSHLLLFAMHGLLCCACNDPVISLAMDLNLMASIPSKVRLQGKVHI